MDPTEIALVVHHGGEVYMERAKVFYTGTAPKPDLNSALSEVQFQIAGAWVRIAKSIKRSEPEAEPTNPFAWSRGPVGE